MKNKRLVAILSILAFITVLIVLSSTVFTLQKVSVNWMTTKDELVGISDDSISDYVSTGVNIFLVDKNDITKNLEKKFPYLRVVGIETKFPNKIIVHSAERQSLFAIRVNDGNDNYYMIIDEKGKVLKKTTSSIFAGGDLGAKPIKVTFEGVGVDSSDYIVGEDIKDESIKSLLTSLSYTMRESGHTPTTSKGIFNEIKIVYAGGEKVINFVTRNGMIISIKDAETMTTDKLLLGLAVYDKNQQNGVVEGVIDVWWSGAQSKLIAVFS